MLPVFPWTDSRSLVTPLMVSRVECVTSYVGRTMSRVSVEPHQDRTGTASAFRLSSGQSPTLMKNSTSGNLTFREENSGGKFGHVKEGNDTSRGRTGHLSAQREQHLVGEHLEVGVSPQGAAVQLVVDDGVVDETPPVGEAVGHFLSEALQVHLRKRLKVGGNLRLVRRTLHGALPVGGVRHGAVAVLMVDWT